MPFHQPTPLSFPVSFPEIPALLIEARIPHKSVPEYLGPPTHVDCIEGLGEADFWAFEYPCGLKVVFEFVHGSESGRVIADSPEIEHVLRHIPFPRASCRAIDKESLEAACRLLLSIFPERRGEIDSLHSFQVWRQGTDGNPFTVGSPTSERDAACWVKHFDSLGHHQHYWYSAVQRP